MENLKTQVDDFSDPKFYKGVFESYLENLPVGNPEGRQWFSGVSLYMQTMKSQLGNSFRIQELEEISSFVEHSLSERFKKEDPTEGDISDSKDFLEQVVCVLEGL